MYIVLVLFISHCGTYSSCRWVSPKGKRGAQH